MIRVVIENILLLLLPTLFYVAYIFLTVGSKGAKQKINDAPFVWLFVAGVVLAIAVLAIFGSTSGGRPGDAYQPPVFEGGKIVPGHIKRDEQSSGG